MGMVTAAAIALGATLISVKAEHRVCAKDADCVQVASACGGCRPCGEPVARAHAQAYVDELAAACKSYDGPQCDAQACERKLRCVQKRCAWVAGSKK